MKNLSAQKVKFFTLGCRVNQYETQAIREQFLKSGGYREASRSEEPDVFVLNTCTVTKESDRESRYWIRRFHREHPNGKIVVTGCYVEASRREVEAIEGVALAVSNCEKSKLLDLYETQTAPLDASVCAREDQGLSRNDFPPLSISRFEGRTRAYVKIQDGCNHACSFCKVVIVRGRSRSRALEDIVDEVKRLAAEGCPEVVLTGIQLGAYGIDFPERRSLADVMDAIFKNPSLKRIRLSSIEPRDVTDELLETMAQNKKCCPHLHIPLQSGCDDVLARMNRRYRSAFYLDLIEKIRRRIPDFVLTTDVMVGFPGESEAQFEKTISVLTEAEPYQLHIFPFSAREGTRAARFSDSVLCEAVKRRMRLLEQLGKNLREKVERRFLGKPAEVIVEEGEPKPGWAQGRTRHYLKVKFPYAGTAGDVCTIKLGFRDGESLIGEISEGGDLC